MAYVGSRTKNVGTWLLPDDESTFDFVLRQRIPGVTWRCSKPGPLGLHPVHLHASLPLALACGGIQGFIHLPLGACLPDSVTLADGVPEPTGPPSAAIVQFLRSSYRHDQGGTYCHLGPGHEHPDGGVYFDAGRLATRWFEDEVGEQMHSQLLDQTREIFSALTAATRPARVVDQAGRNFSGYRIGAAAQDAARERQVPLGRPGVQRFSLA
jgi:hypothetical protein